MESTRIKRWGSSPSPVRNSAILFCGQCLVLQLSLIQVTGMSCNTRYILWTTVVSFLEPPPKIKNYNSRIFFPISYDRFKKLLMHKNLKFGSCPSPKPYLLGNPYVAIRSVFCTCLPHNMPLLSPASINS